VKKHRNLVAVHVHKVLLFSVINEHGLENHHSYCVPNLVKTDEKLHPLALTKDKIVEVGLLCMCKE